MAGTILSPQRGGGLQPGLCLCGSGRSFLQCCGATPSVSRPAVEPVDPQVAALYQAATDAMRTEKAATAKVHLSKLLKIAPKHVNALRLLGRAQKAIGDPAAEEATHQRLLSLQPGNDVLLTDYAGFLYDRQRIHDSAQYSARAVDRNPRNAQAHMLMGLACIKTSTLQRAEYHLRQAQYLQPSNPLANVKLASVLRSLGRMEEARRFYRVTLSLQPGNHEALLGWVKLEEAVKNLEYGWQLLREAERLYPGNLYNTLHAAQLHRRARDNDAALAALQRMDPALLNHHGKVLYYFTLGQTLDALRRYGEAFGAFDAANRSAREPGDRDHDLEGNRAALGKYREFFTREHMQQLPRAVPRRPEEARPVFIVGFPRSGTSMVEQILTAHPAISAGDELILIDRMTAHAPRWLNTQTLYPDCLLELANPEKRQDLMKFRDFYMAEIRTMGIVEPGARRFTDKMPLNELHLGLIKLVFPKAPVIHLLRHPLDVMLSCYSNELQHGDNFAYDLVKAAHYYVTVMDLVEHYTRELDLNYLPIKYEDLVADIEAGAQRMLEFIGEPWDPRCVEFHKNARHARTASYAQVTEKLYSGSVYRYRNYLQQLQPIIPILAPMITRLGYSVD